MSLIPIRFLLPFITAHTPREDVRVIMKHYAVSTFIVWTIIRSLTFPLLLFVGLSNLNAVM
jgi:hypothetical protein